MRSNTRYLFAIAGAFLIFSLTNALSVSNLSKSCLQCLCHAASSCNLTIEAAGGYAGPFWIARVYWSDAGNHTLAADDPMRDRAYVDCAMNYECASIVVTKYMERYGKDCDKDGITDCDDFANVHYWGADCAAASSPKNFDLTQPFFKRYIQCRKATLQANPLL